MSIDLNDAFKDPRTKYLINDKAGSKAILFNPSEEDFEKELKHSREVDRKTWDDYKTKGQISAEKARGKK